MIIRNVRDLSIVLCRLEHEPGVFLAEHPAKPATLLEQSLIRCRLLEGIHHPHRVDRVFRVERLNRETSPQDLLLAALKDSPSRPRMKASPNSTRMMGLALSDCSDQPEKRVE